MKILTVVGARPNFIKLAPLDRELRKDHTCITVHTGQHFDDNMYESFFREFGISKPKYNLHVSNINGKGTHATQTGQMMEHVDRVIAKESPDMVLVYGDTNSSLAGALVAAKRNIPVAHVEAGCRSFDRTMPEEVNRVLIDHMSTLLFCPTQRSLLNICGCVPDDVVLENTGDVTADAVAENIELKDTPADGNYAVMTLHRPSNVDDGARLKRILGAVNASGIDTFFPVHPRTRKIISKDMMFHNHLYPNINFTDPLPYKQLLKLMQNAKVVVTDSGGIQKEAYILKTPCLTIRTTTEWPETL